MPLKMTIIIITTTVANVPKHDQPLILTGISLSDDYNSTLSHFPKSSPKQTKDKTFFGIIFTFHSSVLTVKMALQP